MGCVKRPSREVAEKVMSVLRERGEMSSTDISACIDRKRATVKVAITWLRQNGYIRGHGAGVRCTSYSATSKSLDSVQWNRGNGPRLAFSFDALGEHWPLGTIADLPGTSHVILRGDPEEEEDVEDVEVPHQRQSEEAPQWTS